MYYRYEKNNLLKSFYEWYEYKKEFKDEFKFGFDYVKILRLLESRKLKPADFGENM